MRFTGVILAALLLGIGSQAMAQGISCPLQAHYCTPTAAEAGVKHDLAPAGVQSKMRAQFLPQCKTAMIQGMGPGAKKVADAFCGCSVDAILATPGEWRVLHTVAKESPAQALALEKAIEAQTRSQEKGCMEAIAAGTGLIAPRSAVTGTNQSDQVSPQASTPFGSGLIEAKP